jgi:DNA-binding transcriptional LysR family regulator
LVAHGSLWTRIIDTACWINSAELVKSIRETYELVPVLSLRRFRYFIAVAGELHVGRAAERLGIAQPALSQQLRILEETLGVRLLRRVGRGIALTEAGAAFLPEAQAAIAQSERAIGVARRTARGELGTINIGYVNTAMLEADLPGLLFAFRASVPDARISLEEIAVQEQITALEQHRLDIGIIRAPAGSLPNDLRIRPFTRGRLLAVVPACPSDGFGGRAVHRAP